MNDYIEDLLAESETASDGNGMVEGNHALIDLDEETDDTFCDEEEM